MDDKERIAAWKLDLVRILNIFNVCFIASVRILLTQDSQTELAINTHVAVSPGTSTTMPDTRSQYPIRALKHLFLASEG